MIERFSRSQEETEKLKHRERLYNILTSHQPYPGSCWTWWHKPGALCVTDEETGTVRLQSGPCIIQSPGLHLSLLFAKR